MIYNDSKLLLDLVERRHPDYEDKIGHWDFLQHTYDGGRPWFKGNIFKYVKEGSDEYAERVGRAYRFNHTRECVDLVNKYIFKATVSRKTDASEEIKNFWKEATLSGLTINEFMMMVSQRASIFGRVWIFIDSNKRSNIVTVADEKAAKAKVYAYVVNPQDVLDISFDEFGVIRWMLVRERVRDDATPFGTSGDVKYQYRLWTKYEWFLIDVTEEQNDKKNARIIASGAHDIGMVPAIACDHVLGEYRWSAPGLINDIAYLDRAVANYLSNLDAIIQDQTFSQLVIPAQALVNEGDDEDKVSKIVEMGTKRVFSYDGEGNMKPEYISPDPRQVGVILQVVNKIISEIYHTIGMAGERTKQDNAVGIDNSSGVAKAYDFERMNSLLATKADALESAENWMVYLVMKWHGKELADEKWVNYPDSFDVRMLADEFSIAEKLTLIDAPKEIRREQMKMLVEKLWPNISTQLKAEFDKAIKDWLEMDEAELVAQSVRPSRARVPAERRQGQVTAQT
jgi:hypothetical protein